VLVDDLLSIDACTLPQVDRPLRLAEFDALFTEAVRSVEQTGDRVRLQLVGGAGLRQRVLDLAERESACCSFFTFLVENTTSGVSLEIAVPPGRRGILDALADRAVELSA
jgi:hypothetical protein